MTQTLAPAPPPAAPPRPACSDAERQLARDLARELRATGRRADVRTAWVHRGGPLIGALHAVVGVVASLVGIDHPVWGAALAGGTLLSLLLDAGGRVRPLRRLWPARATQAVVSPPPRGAGAGAIDLLLVARTDVPRLGIADRGRLGRLWLGPERLLALALLLLAAVCGTRIAGADDIAVDAVQLAITVAILLAGAALMDRAAAPRRAADVRAADRALDVTLDVLAELDRAPARRLAPTLILCGAGAETLRPFLHEQRRAGVQARDVAVVEVGACATSGIVWASSDGRVLPLRAHPMLLAAAAAAAGDVPEANAHAVRGCGHGLARAARGLRRPAIAVRVPDPAPGEDEPSTERDDDPARAFVLALVRRLDAALAERD